MIGDVHGQGDTALMRLALEEAQVAVEAGDVPVGAVAVLAGAVVGRQHNRKEDLVDPTAHAELLLLREVASRLGRWRLPDVTVYCTMEPCPMCAWAMHLAGIRRLVLGLRHAALKRTDMGTYSVERFVEMTGCSYELSTGVREAECLALRQRWGKDQTGRPRG